MTTKTLEALLEHRSFVSALALRLTRDACEAQDLEQDVWLAAIQRVDAAAEDHRGWLARLLYSRAGNRRRADSCRRRRERLAGQHRGELTDLPPDELVDRMEQRQRLVQLVLELEEPYRTTVLLRFDRGLSPAAMARELDVPVRTVKTRLHRALEQLREGLDRQAGGDGRTWLAALWPLLDELPATTHPPLVATAMGIGLAVLLLTALLSSVWFFLRPDNPTDTRRAPATLEETASLPSSDPSPSPPLPRSPRIALADARDEGPTDGLRVRIVEVLTRQPVEGASLWFATSDELHPASGLEAPPLERIGRKKLSDRQGLVTLPPLDSQTQVLVRHGDRGARTYLQPDDIGLFEIGIAPWRPLRVQVLDFTGAPATDVDVTLGYRRAGGSAATRRTTSGPEALATFDGLDRILASTREGTPWRLSALPLLESPPTISVDPHALPAEPVRLQLPPLGRVLLRLVDENGLAFDDATLVFIEALPARGSGGEINRLVRNGLLHLPFVEVGTRLCFTIPRERQEAITHEADGPTTVDAEVAVTIVIPRSLPRITGRLVYERDEPLAEREFHYQRGAPIEIYETLSGKTDAEGAFAVELPPPVARKRSDLVSVLATAVPGIPVSLAEVVLPEESSTGDLDLGVIPLSVPPLHARGRVVDTSGRGIPGARVELSRYTPLSNDPAEVAERESLRRRGLGQLTHETVHLLGVDTGENGSFEVRFAESETPCSLQATASGFGSSRQIPFEPGDESVLIRLTRTGAIVGSLSLPGDAIPYPQVRVSLAVETELFREGLSSIRLLLDAGGHFRLRRVPPGIHTVEVSISGIPDPVVVIDEVHVEPGQLCTDPRLREIDLSGAVRTFDLEIVDEEGEPVPAGVIALSTDSADTPSRRVIAFGSGRARFTTRPASWRAKLRAPGHTTTTVPDLQPRQRIVLRCGIPVHLSVPDEVELPPGSWVFDLVLFPPSLEHLGDGRGKALSQLRGLGAILWTVDEDRSKTLTLQESGRWRVRWWVNNTETTRAINLGPTLFEVVEGEGRQAIELVPHPGNYAKALVKIH